MLFLLLLGCSDLPTSPAEVKRRVMGDELPEEGSAKDVVGRALFGPSMEQPCDDRAHAEDAVTADCITGALACGESVEGHTAGGVNNWEGPFYRSKYCTPMPGDYSGSERVYTFAMPAHTLAEIELVSPCEDLDLFVLPWNEASRCPDERHLIAECEADIHPAGGHVQLYTDHNPKTYLVAVDGKGGRTGAFRINTRCRGK